MSDKIHNVGGVRVVEDDITGISYPMTPSEDEAWNERVSLLVDAAFETVSRNPSDYETALAYRRAILAALSHKDI